MIGRSVRAAGGVVSRRGENGEIEVVLIHRPRYDDWTFPKGKAHGGESDEACALREVEEETGLRCSLDRELARSEYRDMKGRTKRVRYWSMQSVNGDLAPGTEVDEARWVPLSTAATKLTYERDRDVLRSFADA